MKRGGEKEKTGGRGEYVKEERIGGRRRKGGGATQRRGVKDR